MADFTNECSPGYVPVQPNVNVIEDLWEVYVLFDSCLATFVFSRTIMIYKYHEYRQ